MLPLQHEHALAVPGPFVPALGRGRAEIIEHEHAERRGQRAVPMSGHMAANVLYRAGFAAANLGQHIQYLRLQPDACPAAPDLDTALHKRTAPLRTIISVRDRATFAKAKSKGSHTVTYD
jgi:hypothetical protein